MSLPGTGPTAVAAVTAVTVKPGHRRRGTLTRMMRAQLHGLHDGGGEAVAALWASEAAIYGRFGYGSAAHHLGVDIPADEPFRPGVELGAERVRQLPRDTAIPLITQLYGPIAAQRPDLKAAHLAKPLAMLIFGMINWTFTWLKAGGALSHESLAPVVIALLEGGLPAVKVPETADVD